MARLWREDDFIGGALCLDFANTVGGRDAGQWRERLQDVEDWLAWSERTLALEAADWAVLKDRARRRPAEAEALLARAKVLREAIHGVFAAVVAGQAPPAEALAVVNRELAAALSRLAVAPAGQGCQWTWSAPPDQLDRLIWPIARSTGELLTSDRLADVRQCAARNCGWLFLDTTKNRSRRWCSMRACGNRAKAQRHYVRARTRRVGPAA